MSNNCVLHGNEEKGKHEKNADGIWRQFAYTCLMKERVSWWHVLKRLGI